MSHHISNLPGGFSESDSLARIRGEMERCKQPQFGATARFPRGKLCPEDEGEFQVRVTCDVRTGTVLIDFDKPVQLLGFTADQAVDLAELIHRRADEVRGRKD